MRKIVLFGVALMFSAATALAQGGGGSSGGGSSNGGGSSSGGGSSNSGSGGKSTSAQKCKSGYVWKKSAKKCVAVQSGILPDSELYEEGRLLAKEGHYDWAITVLSAIQRKDDPDVLNYLGYSNRKAGRIELGLTYYQKALAIDPDFVLAREYLGEGYVAAGKFELARQQLHEIGKRCGTNCEEYMELAEVIEGAS